MLNKKKLLILIGAVILIVVLMLIVQLRNNNEYKGLIGKDIILNNPTSPTPPEFMNEAEKTKFNLPADSKIQVLKRNDAGDTEVYKVIRKDADIVLDPSRISDPDMIQPEK